MEFVNITKIWIDFNIYKEIKNRRLEWPEIYEENIRNYNTFPLSKDRLESILTVYDDNILPPIKLKKVNLMYEIIDGRHRLASAIIKNQPTITAEIM